MTATPIFDALFVEHTIANLTADYWTAASTAPSARYGVACPTCKAAADQPCRTLTTGRVTDTHAARIRGAA
jgi:hypothetical protein